MERSQTWRAACAFIAGLSLAAASIAQDTTPAIVRTGAHFEVHFHSHATDGAVAGKVADEALAAAERTWPAISKLLKMRKATAPTLHLYADMETFRKLEKEHTKNQVPLESFVRLAEQEAHVLLWPQLTPAALAVVGLPETTRQAVMQRSAQLMAAQRCSLAVADPWMAEVFAYVVLEGLVNPKHEFGVDLAYDTRRAVLAHDLKHGNPRELRGSFMDFSIAATRAEHDLQEEKKCLMGQVMAAMNKKWAQKLLPPQKPKKKKMEVPRVTIRGAAVRRVLGKSWTKIESQFSEVCNDVAPVWRVTGAMAAAHKDGLIAAGNSDHTAAFSSQQDLPDGDYVIRSTCKLHPSGEDSFRIQLDWDQKSMIGCFFGVGRVQVKRWSPEKNWELLAEGQAPVHANVAFEVAVEAGQKIRLLVNGNSYVEWDRGDREMRGTWSVGINDCVVWLNKLRLEPLGKK